MALNLRQHGLQWVPHSAPSNVDSHRATWGHAESNLSIVPTSTRAMWCPIPVLSQGHVLGQQSSSGLGGQWNTNSVASCPLVHHSGETEVGCVPQSLLCHALVMYGSASVTWVQRNSSQLTDSSPESVSAWLKRQRSSCAAVSLKLG